MKLALLRGRSTDQGTPGALFRPDGSRLAYTLELPWRDNARGRSCILSPGEYPCRYVVTPKRPAGVYLVQRTPGRDSILIHSGNTAGDEAKGYTSDVLGCILLGLARGTLHGQQAVLLSTPAVRRLADELERQPFTLEVAWTFSPS